LRAYAPQGRTPWLTFNAAFLHFSGHAKERERKRRLAQES
jgi:hypothetical protein